MQHTHFFAGVIFGLAINSSIALAQSTTQQSVSDSPTLSVSPVPYEKFAVPESVFRGVVNEAVSGNNLNWSDTLKSSAPNDTKVKAAEALVFGEKTPSERELGIEAFQSLAAEGSAEASLRLGIAYERGYGVGKNESLAFKYFTEAAKAGNSTAYIAVGRAYREGIGVPVNYKESINWLQGAYDKGNANAATDLARAYQYSIGVSQNLSMSEEFWKAAIGTGTSEAYLGYGEFLAAGASDTIPIADIQSAFQKAAATGDRKAVWMSYDLASAVKDAAAQKVAISQLEQLATSGDSLSNAKLGDAYLNGYIGSSDKLTAYKFYKASADGGNPYGQARMAALILDDPMVDADISVETALHILNVAAKAGEPEAFITLSQHAVRAKRPVESFDLSMVASEIGGATYAKSASDIRLQVCNESVDEKCEPVPVFFITNRRVREKTTGIDLLNELAPNEQLTFGLSQVSVPTKAEFSAERKSWGEIAFDAFKKIFGSSTGPTQAEPNDVVALNEKLPGELRDFLETVKTTATENGRSKAFVYIHGFNNSFDDAARRMARLSEQFKYPGVPIVLSWASAANGSVRLSPQQGYTGSGYLNDSLTVNQSCGSFRTILEAIADKFGSENVMVMGHSMGGRLLYYVLAGCPALDGAWSANRILDNIVLAAPDIDVTEFKQSIESTRSFAKSFTIYVSANDAALKASQELVGGRLRVGQGGDDRLLISGITTIDAYAVENQASSDLANHGYVFDTPQVKHDLSDLLHGQQDPDQRVCPKQYLDVTSGLKYWLIQPGCSS